MDAFYVRMMKISVEDERVLMPPNWLFDHDSNLEPSG